MNKRKNEFKGKKTNKTEKSSVEPHEKFGSFFPNLEEDISKKELRKKKGKKDIAWKKERRNKR